MVNTDSTSTPGRYEHLIGSKQVYIHRVMAENPDIYCHFGYDSPYLRLEIEQVINLCFRKNSSLNISLSITTKESK